MDKLTQTFTVNLKGTLRGTSSPLIFVVLRYALFTEQKVQLTILTHY